MATLMFAIWQSHRESVVGSSKVELLLDATRCSTSGGENEEGKGQQASGFQKESNEQRDTDFR